MTDIEARLDRLESLLDGQQDQIDDQRATIEAQQETIEGQRECIEDLQNAESSESDGERAGTAMVNRRNALKAGGLLALLGVGAGTASADPQGQVGTSSDPLAAVHTEELNGGITGEDSLTDLLGSGLALSDSALTTNLGSGLGFDGSDRIELASDAVGSDELENAAVGNDELASDAVGSNELTSDAVGGDELAASHNDLDTRSGDHHVRPQPGDGLYEELTRFHIQDDSIGTDELNASAVAGPNLISNDGKLELDSSSISAGSIKFEATEEVIRNSNKMAFETSASATGSSGTDARGRVGTSSQPLRALYTAELNGPVTGDTAVTSLVGDGLAVDSGALSAAPARPDVDAGGTPVENVPEIEFGEGLTVIDDGEGTVTVETDTSATLTVSQFDVGERGGDGPDGGNDAPTGGWTMTDTNDTTLQRRDRPASRDELTRGVIWDRPRAGGADRRGRWS